MFESIDHGHKRITGRQFMLRAALAISSAMAALFGITALAYRFDHPLMTETQLLMDAQFMGETLLSALFALIATGLIDAVLDN